MASARSDIRRPPVGQPLALFFTIAVPFAGTDVSSEAANEPAKRAAEVSANATEPRNDGARGLAGATANTSARASATKSAILAMVASTLTAITAAELAVIATREATGRGRTEETVTNAFTRKTEVVAATDPRHRLYRAGAKTSARAIATLSASASASFAMVATTLTAIAAVAVAVTATREIAAARGRTGATMMITAVLDPRAFRQQDTATIDRGVSASASHQ